MRIHLVFFLFIFFGLSCTRNQSGFTINGHLSNSKGEKIILCEMGVKEITPLDSTNIDPAGKFQFSCKTSQPGFYLLIFPDGSRITLVIKNGENLILDGNRKDPIADYIISGSQDSQLLQDFFHATMKNKIRIDSIKNILKSHEGSDDLLIISMIADSSFSVINTDQKKLEKAFIDKHPTSLASLIVLNFSFGPKPVLLMDEDFPYYEKLTGLARVYPTNKHVIYHLERVKLFEKGY
jgi:hypothetical protein